MPDEIELQKKNIRKNRKINLRPNMQQSVNGPTMKCETNFILRARSLGAYPLVVRNERNQQGKQHIFARPYSKTISNSGALEIG